MSTGATPKGRALARLLREAREETGLTLRALAGKLELDPARLSRWETAQLSPKPEHVAQILTALEITGDRFNEIISLTHNTDDTLWVATTIPAQRQQMAALIECEQTARSITVVHPCLVPGLLQTSDYVRAIMAGEKIPADELATRVVTRLGRQTVLTRDNPVPFTALIGEAVLRQVIGDRRVTADQLRHVIQAAKRPKIDVRIVPSTSGWHPGLIGPFDLIDSEFDAAIVHLETRSSGLFFHDEKDVKGYQDAVEEIRAVALSADDSLSSLEVAIREMETGE
jgi:transcriptional regulator with XRE-family HTH domain